MSASEIPAGFASEAPILRICVALHVGLRPGLHYPRLRPSPYR
jgi:hypothetical protein